MAKQNYSGKANPETLTQIKDIAWKNKISTSALIEMLMEKFIKSDNAKAVLKKSLK